MRGKLVRLLALAAAFTALAAVGVAAAFAGSNGHGHDNDGGKKARAVSTTGTTSTQTTTTATTTTTTGDDDNNKDDKNGKGGKDDDNKDDKDGKGGKNGNGDNKLCFDDICSTWDAQWLKMSIEGDRYEIAAGNLALSKSSNSAVRTLAQTLVTDHSKSLEDAIELAHKFHIEVPSEPSPTQQWILWDLSQHTGQQFDYEFSSIEVKDHQQDIDEAQTEVDCGVIPAIKNDAKDELPMLRKHLELSQPALAASTH